MLSEENENTLYEILEGQSSSTQKVRLKSSLLASSPSEKGTRRLQPTRRCLVSCFFGSKVLDRRKIPFTNGKELLERVPASPLSFCGALAVSEASGCLFCSQLPLLGTGYGWPSFWERLLP